MRSFDLRIATADNSAFVLTHGGLISYSSGAAYPINTLLASVVTWLGTNTEEIILLNFNRFLHLASGTFTHANLITIIDTALSGKIIDCATHASSNDFRVTLRRQILDDHCSGHHRTSIHHLGRHLLEALDLLLRDDGAVGGLFHPARGAHVRVL